MKIQVGTSLEATIDAADYPKVAELGAWAPSGKGYASARVQGRKRIYLHRLILDAPDGIEVDHINGDHLDNRRSNLRFVTHSQNMQNRTKARYLRGVKKLPSGRYGARLQLDKKYIHLGVFNTAEGAVQAARRGRRRYMTHAGGA